MRSRPAKRVLCSLRNTGEVAELIRSIIGWSGAFVGAACSLVLVLGMLRLIPGLDSEFIHQSGFRWLAEGAIGGLMIAAIAFWRFID